MTTADVVETSATVNNNSPIQDYVHPDDQTQPTVEMTPGFKPFTVSVFFLVFLVSLKIHFLSSEKNSQIALQQNLHPAWILC